MASLLAVDLGLRHGLALFGDDGRLRWCRSHHVGSRTQLKGAIHHTLAGIDDLRWVVVEGDRALAALWEKAAARRGAELLAVSPERWRERVMPARMRAEGDRTKEHALTLAREFLSGLEGVRPTALRHDTAEAILIGIWGLLELGWAAREGATLLPRPH